MSNTFELRRQFRDERPEVLYESPRYDELRKIKKDLEKDKHPDARYWITVQPPVKEPK